MTEKEAREYLGGIRELERKISDTQVQIIELRTIAESCTVRTDKERVQSSGTGDKMANLVGKILELEQKVQQNKELVRERRETFEKVTKKMPDDKQREFLTVRYYDGNGFYDTVMKMDLSDSTGRRIHRKAISKFAEIFTDSHKI